MSKAIYKLNPKLDNKLIGHNNALEMLESIFSSEKIPHSWLITGSKGIGKATFIHNFIYKLFTKNLSDLEDIEAVKSQIQNNSHSNILVISKQVDKKFIPVEEIKNIRKFLQLSSAGAGHKIVIIDSVDDMNHNSANALLKILEEPPKGCFLFLINHSPAKLFDTIKSRCNILKLSNLPENEIKELFIDSNISNNELTKNLLYLSKNSPGISLDLYHSKIFDIYESLLSLFEEEYSYKDIEKFFGNRKSIIGNEITIMTIIFNHLFINILKTKYDLHYPEIINREKERILKISQKKNIASWLSLCDTQQKLLKETYNSNLDLKHTLLTIINSIKDTN